MPGDYIVKQDERTKMWFVCNKYFQNVPIIGSYYEDKEDAQKYADNWNKDDDGDDAET